MTLKRGDHVWITYDGQTLPALVGIASPNGRAAMLMFDGILGGYVGTMPVFADDADLSSDFIDLLHGHEVILQPAQITTQ